MQVFKAYFKIIKKHLPTLSIYFFIFFFFLAFMTFADFGGASSSPAEQDFSGQYTRLVIINEDQDHPISAGLEEYLDANSDTVDYEEYKDRLEDALFYLKIQYILTIPEGFGDALVRADSSVQLQKKTVADMTAVVGTDMLVDRYISMARLSVVASGVDSDNKEELDKVRSDVLETLDTELEINMPHVESEPFLIADRMTTFGFYSYSIMAIMILGVTTITSVFNKSDVRSRIKASPIKNNRMQMQLFMGNMTFCLAVWALISVIILVFTRDAGFDFKTALLLVNALVFSVMCLSFAFFVGNMTQSRNAQHAIANVVALGFSFIGGVFVPQAFLGDQVNRIARLTPTHWYIAFIEELRVVNADSWYQSQTLWLSLAIQISFALALLGVSLVLSANYRRKTV